jgi:DNA-binding NarL/FixJ family response regulator
MQRSSDSLADADSSDSVIKIYLDGKPCYIIPKTEQPMQRNSHCVGEIDIGERSYHVIEMVRAENSVVPMTHVVSQGELLADNAHVAVGCNAQLLTGREREIALLVASGLLNKQIADRLNVSVYTVSTHLRRIYTKLGVRNRTSLALKLKE